MRHLQSNKEGRNEGREEGRKGGRERRNRKKRKKGSRNKNVCTMHILMHGVCMILARWSRNAYFE